MNNAIGLSFPQVSSILPKNPCISLSYSSLKNELTSSLNILQKKVTYIALAIFAAFALLVCTFYICLRSTKLKDRFFSRKAIKIKPAISQKLPTEVLKINSSEQDKQTKLPLKQLSLPKCKTIAERLEKNRKYALEQQKNEEDKGFEIQNLPLPNQIKILNHKKRWKYRKIFEGKEEVGGMSVGFASCQGIRPTMEDAEIATHQLFNINNVEHSFDLFGVFDGHGGDQASAYVKENIVLYLKNALEKFNSKGLSDEGIFKALKECCQKLDADYKGIDGTTATIAVILKGQIWVANVGDSRTILVKNGKAVQASEDARPCLKRYRKTVTKLGGYVAIYLGKFGRVNGILAVARAIGDKGIQGWDGEECCISANPKITSYDLEDFKEGYLVLACDGLYDEITTDRVGKAIEQMQQWGDSVEKMSKRLVVQSIAAGSQDNVSVMIVKL